MNQNLENKRLVKHYICLFFCMMSLSVWSQNWNDSLEKAGEMAFNGEPAAALIRFTRIIKNCHIPDIIFKAHRERTMAAMMSGKTEIALTDINYVIQNRPEGAIAYDYNVRAQIYYKLKDETNMKTDIEKLKSMPFNGTALAEILRFLGSEYLSSEKYNLAISYLEDYRNNCPLEPEMLTKLGIAYQNIERYDSAEALFTQSIEQFSYYISALENRAILYIVRMNKETDPAIKDKFKSLFCKDATILGEEVFSDQVRENVSLHCKK